MRSLLVFVVSLSLTMLIFCCKQSGTETLNYSSLNYDTSRIFIFSWDIAKYFFPGNSAPLPLSQDDLKTADNLLKDAIDSFNTYISPGLYEAFERRVPIDSFLVNQDRYKYQYFPGKDVNGRRVLKIIGFSTDYRLWKQAVYKPVLHYGTSMIELNIDLTEKSRDNLRSGDFG